ncbi:MAG: glutamine--tRNA ligase [Halobacteriovoraceae bacterium]|nr:glutamine--tRNA ligase [Halobacteriovoraceae bacterium]
MEKGVPTDQKEHRNFIENIIAEDLKSGKHDGWVITRFPPEPNGYLHLGHTKSICLNFGLARDNVKTRCHLRFDDTNPLKESTEYVNAIKEDIKWLGFDWGENLHFSSDYFDTLYGFAVELIEKGLAYVDSQSPEEIAENRGTFEAPGKNSPFRERSVEENLKMFTEMKEGKYKDGEHVLRAKIDMAHGNMCMRDPILYRIRHVEHHRTGDQWKIYPMYDFTHGLSDSIENITHSLCTLEFQDNRPLYDWFVENVSSPSTPRQIEFAKLNLDYTLMSKRKLLQLVEGGHVEGWDDPRMATISGVRRRGYPAKAIRKFNEMIGVGKQESVIELSILEERVRDELNQTTKRCMGVIDPIKVTITNWEEDHEIDAPFHPKDESFGSRKVKFGKELYIERSDFMEDPPSPKKWFRLGPNRSVRLRYAYVITCDEYVKDDEGNVVELKCRYHKDSFGGVTPEGMKKVKGIIHWVNAEDAKNVEVRLYDRLFKHENPSACKDFLSELNPESLKIVEAKVEPFLADAKPNDQFQFERMGYFTADSKLSSQGKPVFNRTVTLKDNWQKKK